MVECARLTVYMYIYVSVCVGEEYKGYGAMRPMHAGPQDGLTTSTKTWQIAKVCLIAVSWPNVLLRMYGLFVPLEVFSPAEK